MRAIDNRLKRLESGGADGGFLFRKTVYEAQDGSDESAFVVASMLGYRGQALRSSDYPTPNGFVTALRHACRVAWARELTAVEMASASAATFHSSNPPSQ